ncbi:MAG TPA: nucleotidyltransferase domain-containing protein [Candidatus Aquicultor sp.]|jgi:predicted nucleotidyltransferase
MARTRTDIIKTINRFILEAKNRFDIEKVVLYGSQITGDVDEWSDIDIAVISDDFEGIDLRQRLMLLNKIAWEQQVTEIDALGYTQAEYAAESPLSFSSEIKENGIVVYEKR